MTVKTTGAEWKAFYKDTEFWPEGSWHEDEILTINGRCGEVEDDYDLMGISDTDQLSISDGVVHLRADDLDGPTLETHFRRWRKKQVIEIFAVEVHRDLKTAVIQAIQQAGGKVKK